MHKIEANVISLSLVHLKDFRTLFTDKVVWWGLDKDAAAVSL
jgi:hypothetical protein